MAYVSGAVEGISSENLQQRSPWFIAFHRQCHDAFRSKCRTESQQVVRSHVDMSALRRCVEAEKQFESLVDAGKFARRYLSKDAADAPLVD